MKAQRVTVVEFLVVTPKFLDSRYVARSADVVDLHNMGLWPTLVEQSRLANCIRSQNSY